MTTWDNSYFRMPTSDTSIRRIIGRLTDFITIVVQSCLFYISFPRKRIPLLYGRRGGEERRKRKIYIILPSLWPLL